MSAVIDYNGKKPSFCGSKNLRLGNSWEIYYQSVGAFQLLRPLLGRNDSFAQDNSTGETCRIWFHQELRMRPPLLTQLLRKNGTSFEVAEG